MSESLESLKKQVIARLKELDQKEESKQLKKAVEYFTNSECLVNHLEKSISGEWIEKAGYGVGTIRVWKGKKYKKVSSSPVKWVRVFDKMDRGAKSSMTRLIHKVQNCKDENELYQFCLSNHALFQDENGIDLPIMDKLRAAIDEKKNGTQNIAKPTESKKDVDYTKMTESELSNLNKELRSKMREKGFENTEEEEKQVEAITRQRAINFYKVKEKHTLSHMSSSDQKEVIESGLSQTKKDIEKKEKQLKKLESADKHDLSKMNKVHNEIIELKYKQQAYEQLEKEFVDFVPKTEKEKITKEEEKKENDELNMSDTEINSLTDVNYLKELQKKVVKENNRLNSEKKYDDANDMARRNYVISDRIKQLESEKHQNRSDAMKSNDNAKKDNAKPTITFDRKGKLGEKAVNYSSVKSSPADSPNGKKVAIEKATVTNYHYNDAHPEAKQITIPASKEVTEAFKRLDSVLNHGKVWRSTRAYERHFGVQDGYLYTTDGRQLKRVRIDGLDGLPENGMYEAAIENGNLVLKEQPTIGKYPLASKVVPQHNDKTLRLDNKALKDRIKELKDAKYLTKKQEFVDIKIKNGNLMIGNTKVGKTDNYSGDDFTMRVNYNFILNSLSKGDSSILNFAEDFNTDSEGNNYLNKTVGISENTGDNIFVPANANSKLPDPDEHLKDSAERGDKIREMARNIFADEMKSDRNKDIDTRLKDRAAKFLESLKSDKLYSNATELSNTLNLVNRILNEERFTSMGLKPEFGKTDGSKYVRFRDKNDNPFGAGPLDSPLMSKFIKELAKDGAFGEMKKSDLRDMTSLESYVKKSISILKKSLIG